MDKLIFTAKRCAPVNGPLIRLDSDAMAIVQETQIRTGLPASVIVGKMIRFCEPRIEIAETAE